MYQQRSIAPIGHIQKHFNCTELRACYIRQAAQTCSDNARLEADFIATRIQKSCPKWCFDSQKIKLPYLMQNMGYQSTGREILRNMAPKTKEF
jgi:hypothetical protein